MNAYSGIYRHTTGIHNPLDRSTVARLILEARKQGKRADARSWRNWLIYLGTFPLKPITDIDKWATREWNKGKAFMKRYNAQQKGEW